MRRTFGRRRAVDGVDLVAAAGDCLALFGPNGAGKTTLLRLLAGLLAADQRAASTSTGKSVRDGRDACARTIGLISHQSMLYRALTARENVEFAARLYGVDDPARRGDARARAHARRRPRRHAGALAEPRAAAARVDRARDRARAAVVLLDEPYTGLDAAGGAALTDMLQRAARGAARRCVLVTHNVDEGLAVASHAAVMLAGRIVRLDESAALDAARTRRVSRAGPRRAWSTLRRDG